MINVSDTTVNHFVLGTTTDRNLEIFIADQLPRINISENIK